MINNSDNRSSSLNCLNYTHIYTHILPKKNSCTQCALFFFVTLFFLFQEVKQ